MSSSSVEDIPEQCKDLVTQDGVLLKACLGRSVSDLNSVGMLCIVQNPEGKCIEWRPLDLITIDSDTQDQEWARTLSGSLTSDYATARARIIKIPLSELKTFRVTRNNQQMQFSTKHGVWQTTFYFQHGNAEIFVGLNGKRDVSEEVNDLLNKSMSELEDATTTHTSRNEEYEVITVKPTLPPRPSIPSAATEAHRGVLLHEAAVALYDRRTGSKKDVNRTDRTHPFYAGDNNPNLIVLEDILMTYVMYNFDLGYVQGMSDILAPLLLLLNNEVDISAPHLTDQIRTILGLPTLNLAASVHSDSSTDVNEATTSKTVQQSNGTSERDYSQEETDEVMYQIGLDMNF
ncbi:TBC1 domain family member 15 [Operophtera brumata]|uniref:TBC1 domain family member 15 n=1 Tax=Operophtera brumata TaxID=104452 RepID=A0A0L7LQ92_OPEBR|nr:TBC1 domain family member 15 [Operophtera brumata]